MATKCSWILGKVLEKQVSDQKRCLFSTENLWWLTQQKLSTREVGDLELPSLRNEQSNIHAGIFPLLISKSTTTRTFQSANFKVFSGLANGNEECSRMLLKSNFYLGIPYCVGDLAPSQQVVPLVKDLKTFTRNHIGYRTNSMSKK